MDVTVLNEGNRLEFRLPPGRFEQWVSSVLVTDEDLNVIWRVAEIRTPVIRPTQLQRMTNVRVMTRSGEPLTEDKWQQIREHLQTEAGLQLESIAYGEVPPGMRQDVPVGTAPNLEPGHRYCVVIDSLAGQHVTEFQAPSPSRLTRRSS